MEEVLVIIVQFLIEFLFDVFLQIPFDWPSRTRKTPEPESIFGQCLLWLVFSIALGFISIYVFRHSLITNPDLRIANLFLAPLASAAISKAIATRRAIRNPNIIPRNHYWQAFWFTLGYTGVRFAFATHV